MSTRIVTRDGTGLFARVSGPESAPVTVLLAYGWTLDERCWAPVADASPSARPVPARPAGDPLRPPRARPLRRHPDELKTLDVLADDMAEVITRLAPSGPLVIAGHSMGGMTAMALAQRHPDLVASRVAGVALVATAVAASVRRRRWG